jgi:7-cyano-7-deazaguanine synthase
MMSGGIDSAACAHFLRQQGLGVDALFLDYGQAAAKLKAKAVMALSRHLGISIQCFNLSGSGPFGTGELVGRNALLVFAALFLTRGRSGLLALGLHGGTPYYDCSGPFPASIAHLVCTAARF